MRYLERSITLAYDSEPVQRVRDVRDRVPARGVPDGSETCRAVGPWRVHGVRRLLEEL